jgi:uncharacterized protein
MPSAKAWREIIRRPSCGTAGQGNAAAHYFLGTMYDYGEGVPKNFAQAIDWYRKAGDQGNADAQNNLGTIYYDGKGVPQDYTQALGW